MNRSAGGLADRSFRSALGAVAAILVVALFIAGLRSYRDLAVHRARQAALTEKITKTKLRIEQLEQDIELLRSDHGTLERFAREDLGMTRPGDIVIRIPEAETDPSAEAAPES